MSKTLLRAPNIQPVTGISVSIKAISMWGRPVRRRIGYSVIRPTPSAANLWLRKNRRQCGHVGFSGKVLIARGWQFLSDAAHHVGKRNAMSVRQARLQSPTEERLQLPRRPGIPPISAHRGNTLSPLSLRGSLGGRKKRSSSWRWPSLEPRLGRSMASARIKEGTCTAPVSQHGGGVAQNVRS